MLEAAVVAWALAGAVPAVLMLIGAFLILRRCPLLDDLQPREPEVWPALTVVIAACNEADTIEPALASVLALDYPNLQILIVDDRSTDGTGEIVDRIAARDPRVTAKHIRELPEGWLGKVHAYQRALEDARGAWVLFTDADVHFAPGAMRRAVAVALERGLDHFTVLPEIPLRGFWVGVCVGAALRSICVLLRPWEASDPRSPKAVGSGAFNLVRREAFDRTPGFEWLKLEVADDIGLGLMMKRSGAKTLLALGPRQVRVEWYRTLGEAVRGLEKNGFAQAARFRLHRALLMISMVPIVSFGLFAGLLPIGPPWLWMVSAVALAGYTVCSLVLSHIGNVRFLYVWLSLPLGDVLMAYIILRATILGLRRGGVVWRGTVYPTALLEAGRRVDM